MLVTNVTVFNVSNASNKYSFCVEVCVIGITNFVVLINLITSAENKYINHQKYK